MARLAFWAEDHDRAEQDQQDACTQVGHLAHEGVSEQDMAELLKVDVAGWKKEVADVRQNHYSKFGDKLPKELSVFLDSLEAKLNNT